MDTVKRLQPSVRELSSKDPTTRSDAAKDLAVIATWLRDLGFGFRLCLGFRGFWDSCLKLQGLGCTTDNSDLCKVPKA